MKNNNDTASINDAAEKYIPDNLVIKVEARNSKDKLNHYEEMILKCNVVEIISKILTAQLQLNKKIGESSEGLDLGKDAEDEIEKIIKDIELYPSSVALYNSNLANCLYRDINKLKAALQQNK